MYTRARFAPYVEKLLLDGARSKLTRAALETLAVVAYRQPVTRARVSAVRGVNVDAVMRTLLARGLITEAGADEDTGAVTFATTELFPGALGTDVAGRPARHRAAASRRRHDRGPQRITGQRATFHQTRRRSGRRAVTVVRRGSGLMVESEEPRGPRLQKVLSQAGIASRRAAEKLIIDGRVEVDGQVVTELGTRVDPDVSVIRVDGARVVVDDSMVYLALNKPRGMHSTMSDDRGRPCIGDLIERQVRGQQEAVSRRAAGRRHRRADPADQRRRTGAPADASLARGAQDVSGDGDRVGAAGAGQEAAGRHRIGRRTVRTSTISPWWTLFPGKTLVRLTLHEGRNAIVRRLLAAVGFPVEALVRTDIGAVSLGKQRPGSIRALRLDEIGQLYKAVGL